MTTHRRTHRMSSACGAWLTLLLCVLVGCSGSSPEGAALRTADSPVSSENDFSDFEGAGVEYDQAVAELALPPGMVFRELEEMASDRSGTYQEGLPTTLAQVYWMDAWTIEWLEQRGKDPEREARALNVLKNEVPESELMTVKVLANARDRVDDASALCHDSPRMWLGNQSRESERGVSRICYLACVHQCRAETFTGAGVQTQVPTRGLRPDLDRISPSNARPCRHHQGGDHDAQKRTGAMLHGSVEGLIAEHDSLSVVHYPVREPGEAQ